jgi:hypothetical protein
MFVQLNLEKKIISTMDFFSEQLDVEEKKKVRQKITTILGHNWTEKGRILGRSCQTTSRHAFHSDDF